MTNASRSPNPPDNLKRTQHDPAIPALTTKALGRALEVDTSLLDGLVIAHELDGYFMGQGWVTVSSAQAIADKVKPGTEIYPSATWPNGKRTPHGPRTDR